MVEVANAECEERDEEGEVCIQRARDRLAVSVRDGCWKALPMIP
jgi:hypothetical protein